MSRRGRAAKLDKLLYVARGPNGVTKIGITHAPPRRLRSPGACSKYVEDRINQLRAASPVPIDTLGFRVANTVMERGVHVILAAEGRWSHGEWFRMTEGEAFGVVGGNCLGVRLDRWLQIGSTGLLLSRDPMVWVRPGSWREFALGGRTDP